MTRFERLAITVGGLGYLRPAPGTWGSLPPVVLALGLALVAAPLWQINAALALIGLAFAVACWRFGAKAELEFAKKDPSHVVADEVAGQAIALLGLPWVVDDALRNATLALVAFLAFRLFDIVKPPPARGIQALKGGAGILIDDLVAGVYALIVVQVVVRMLLP